MNDVGGLTHDNVHGSGSLNTMFRNRMNGDYPNKTNFRIPLSLQAQQRYNSNFGNVMGTSGYHTRYQIDDTNDSPPGADNFIQQVGFWNRWDSAQTPYDTLTKTTWFKWGNYDTVNAANRFNNADVPTFSSSGDFFAPIAIPFNQTLPVTLYLGLTSAFPSGGTGLAWWKNPTTGAIPQFPPIGPDVTCTTNCIASVASHANKIPARQCYEMLTKDAGGYPTNFDPDICYALDSGGGPNPPAAPTGLTGTIH